MLGLTVSNERGLHLSSSGWPVDKPQNVSSFLYGGFVFARVSVCVFLFSFSVDVQEECCSVLSPKAWVKCNAKQLRGQGQALLLAVNRGKQVS